MKKEDEKSASVLTVVKDNTENTKEVNKPTPEEAAQFKEEFEKSAEAFKTTKWEISEKGKFGANDVGMFIMDFMKKFAFWTKTGWMGMLKMTEELNKAMNLVDENTGLQLEYQALEFLAYMLSNPGNTGLDAAIEFEQIADKYSKIGIVIGTKLEEARKQLKDLQYLQEKWAAAEQGYYLAELEPKKEEKLEGNAVEIDISKKEEKPE
jgi:hypothetical protein